MATVVFPYAARADDADEPPHHQLRRQGANGVIAADHASQLGRQPVEPIGDSGLSRRRGLRYGGGLRRGVCHRRDKAVSTTGDSHDVASAAPIAQRFPQVSDMVAD